jgi:tRNA 2-selenouridine synthase SelU
MIIIAIERKEKGGGKTMNIYNQLEEKVQPLLQAFKTDLTKHDKETIELNPETPFLHYTFLR